jgi:hypothetical protein
MKFQALTILLLLLPASAMAHWPMRVIEQTKVFDQKAQYISSSPVATFWGGIKRYLHIPWNNGETIELKSQYFKDQKLPLYLSDPKSKSSTLFVFLPGVYGQPGRGLTPQVIDYLEDMDAQVLVVPNLLSPIYIEARPLYQIDPIEAEIQIMEEALSFVLKERPQITKIHVLAESLGSSIASVWVAHDRSHQKRITDLTLLWPPIDLFFAMKNFDEMIESHSKFECNFMSDVATIGLNFVLRDFPEQLSEKQIQCMGKAVMVDGFLKATKRSWTTYNSTIDRDNPGEAPKSFEDFFKSYRPEVWEIIKTHDERLKLTHNLSQVRKEPNFKLRIMTSQNDYLNFNLNWSDVKKELDLKDNELIIMNWGGHSGPMGLKNFKEIIRETFSEVN